LIIRNTIVLHKAVCPPAYIKPSCLSVLQSKEKKKWEPPPPPPRVGKKQRRAGQVRHATFPKGSMHTYTFRCVWCEVDNCVT
jgi:hypothetical protein